jgi:putative aldouronate transport system permease protein
MFILSLGGLINGNLEQAKLMSNNFNRNTSEIINLYVLNVGLVDFRFDYAAAVGLMQSAVSAVLVFSSNWFSRRFAGASIY